MAENGVEHIGQVIGGLRRRLAQIEEDSGGNILPAEDLAGELEEAEGRCEAAARELQACAAELASARETVDADENALASARAEAQELRDEYAAVDAMQQVALGGENREALEWIVARGLDGVPRLGAELIVESGWERGGGNGSRDRSARDQGRRCGWLCLRFG